MTKGTNKNSNKKVLFLAIGALVVAVFVLVQMKPKTNPPVLTQPSPEALQEFQSDLLGFKIKIPQGFTVEDRQINLILKNNDMEIVVRRNGTNFSNLNDYLSNFDAIRNLKVSQSTVLTINGSDALGRNVVYLNDNSSEKVYYIYANYSVYIISTTSPDLYDDLDQIAKSFEYLGD